MRAIQFFSCLCQTVTINVLTKVPFHTVTFQMQGEYNYDEFFVIW